MILRKTKFDISTFKRHYNILTKLRQHTITHQRRREENSSDKCCYVTLCYSDVNVALLLCHVTLTFVLLAT